jgi:hypothetical protein
MLSAPRNLSSKSAAPCCFCAKDYFRGRDGYLFLNSQTSLVSVSVCARLQKIKIQLHNAIRRSIVILSPNTATTIGSLSYYTLLLSSPESLEATALNKGQIASG